MKQTLKTVRSSSSQTNKFLAKFVLLFLSTLALDSVAVGAENDSFLTVSAGSTIYGHVLFPAQTDYKILITKDEISLSMAAKPAVYERDFVGPFTVIGADPSTRYIGLKTKKDVLFKLSCDFRSTYICNIKQFETILKAVQLQLVLANPIPVEFESFEENQSPLEL